MGELWTQKFKECPPGATIARVRGILADMGLAPIESEWYRQSGGFYSLRLTLPGTLIGVNGKGTTAEYALASAYGEMMERLSNMAPFRLAVDMPERAHRRGSFLYAPDEMPMGMGEILSSDDPWMRRFWDSVPEGTDRVSYLRLWKQIGYEQRASDFYGIGFESLIDGKKHVLPVKMLSKLYMSNGMCAGNTWEEALIQGLCECYERYANRQAVLHRLPLVEIERERIEAWPAVARLVHGLEEDGRYGAALYDASLGMGLPVAAVLLTDRSAGRYFVKFGAAPSPELSVERTLTELMQGQRTGNVMGMQPIHVDPPIRDQGQNMIGILTHGIGAYPFACFSEGAGGGALPDYSAPTGRGTLASLIRLARGLGYDVLVRDASHLGFPAAHVVVPFMSEVGDFADREEINRYARYNEIKRMVRALGTLSEEDARGLLTLLEPFPAQTGVLDLLYLEIEGPTPWYYKSVRFLMISLALRCGDLPCAAGLLDEQAAEAEAAETGSSLYFRCARDVCLLRAQGKSDGAVKESLDRFYPVHMLAPALNDMQPGSALYRRLGTLPCFECGVCPWRAGCGHPGTEEVYGVLKKRMKRIQ